MLECIDICLTDQNAIFMLRTLHNVILEIQIKY